MKIKIIPENDYDRVELGLMTPEELGEKLATKNINEIKKKFKEI